MSCWPGAAPLAWAGPRQVSSGMAPRCSIASRASSRRAVDGPVVVVRAPDQELPDLPPGVRVVEDAAEGRGPLQGLAAGLAAVAGEAEVAYVSSTDVPLLHPAFVGAVLNAATREDVDVALPVVHGFRHPLAAAYRTSLLPAVEELIERGPHAAGIPVRAQPRARAERGGSAARPRARGGGPRAALGAERERARRLRARAGARGAERDRAPLRHARRRTSAASRSRSGRPRSRRPPRRPAWRSTATWWPRSTATRSRATPSCRSPAGDAVAFLAADAGG